MNKEILIQKFEELKNGVSDFQNQKMNDSSIISQSANLKKLKSII